MQHFNKVIALVDINNCYVSCERIFNPKLLHRPVIVLSNNDGCAVSRSEEAKQLGIKMGAPLFKIEELIQQHQVQVLSSNYALYAEMSRRFVKLLETFVEPEELEVYSVDECFLDLTRLSQQLDMTVYCSDIRKCIELWLGLPVCIGIGRSKTEAKLANQIAKTNTYLKGICNLEHMDFCSSERFYEDMDVAEVWGVGRKNLAKLQQLGIHSALDLVNSSSKLIKKNFSVVMQRTVMELQGISCIQLETSISPRKQILSSRSFGQRITALDDLKEAVLCYTLEAVKKLRKDQLYCRSISVFLQSNRFDQNTPYYNQSLTRELTDATDDYLVIAKITTQLIEHLYRENIAFKKCGVSLNQLFPLKACTDDLFSKTTEYGQNQMLMQTFDQIHEKFGKNILGIGASTLTKRNWSMRKDKLSPNYFKWSEIMLVH